MKWLLIMLMLFAGCQERFRYTCQNPKNWEDADCKRPLCSINGVCPDQLNRPEDSKAEK